MEKPKNLYARHMDMNFGGTARENWGTGWRRTKGKIGTTVMPQSIEFYFKNTKERE